MDRLIGAEISSVSYKCTFDSYSKCESIVILRSELESFYRESTHARAFRVEEEEKKERKKFLTTRATVCRSDLCMWLTSYLASTLSRSCDSSTSGSFAWMAGVALAITRSSRWNSRSGKRGSHRSFSPFFLPLLPIVYICMYVCIYECRYPFRSLKNHRALLPWLWWIVYVCVTNSPISFDRSAKESVQFAFHSFVYIQFAYIDRVEKVKSFIRLYRQSWKSKVALIIYQNARITFNRSAKESVEFAFHSFVYSLIDRVEKVKLH